MTAETRCLRQFIRPKIYVPVHGIGNCIECKPDENNKNCKGYFPLTLEFFEEKEK